MTDPDLSDVDPPDPDPDIDPADEDKGSDSSWRDETPATDRDVEALTEYRHEAR